MQKQYIDKDALIAAIQEKAKEPSIAKNLDTVNGLCGAVSIIYEMPTIEIDTES